MSVFNIFRRSVTRAWVFAKLREASKHYCGADFVEELPMSEQDELFRVISLTAKQVSKSLRIVDRVTIGLILLAKLEMNARNRRKIHEGCFSYIKEHRDRISFRTINYLQSHLKEMGITPKDCKSIESAATHP